MQSSGPGCLGSGPGQTPHKLRLEDLRRADSFLTWLTWESDFTFIRFPWRVLLHWPNKELHTAEEMERGKQPLPSQILTAMTSAGPSGAPDGPNFSSLKSIPLSALLSSSFPSQEQPWSHHQTPDADPPTATLSTDCPDNTSQSMWGPRVLAFSH